MEVELPNTQRVTSSDYWSLASNQYPSGKFPKVSIGITIPRTESGSRGRDAAITPTLDRNLSQGTDGRSRLFKEDKASHQVSLKPADHDGSVKGKPEAVFGKRASVVQTDNNTPEQPGTFSFGTRREQGSHLDQMEGSTFVSFQGKCQEEHSDKSKSNTNMLRMKLQEILGGSSQNKQAATSPIPDDLKTPDQQKVQPVNGTVTRSTSQNKQAIASPNPDDMKTPDQRNSKMFNFTKCKPFSDLIESDSVSPKQVKARPVTRSLARNKAASACKLQHKSVSAKKPLPSFRSAPKQKIQDSLFVFNNTCKPKTVGKSTIGESSSLKNLRSSNKKAKTEPQKKSFAERISDKTTQDDGEENLPCRKLAPQESKGNVSLSSLSRTGKTAESYSNSSKKEERLNTMTKVGPRKMQFSENLSDKAMKEIEELCSPKKNSSKSKENDSLSSLLHHRKTDTLKRPEASDRSPHSHRAAGNIFDSLPLSGAAGTCAYAANPPPEGKTYHWEHAASPKIIDSFGQKVSSPFQEPFRDMLDDTLSPTFAMNVNISAERSKLLDEDLYSPKCSKSLDRSGSGSYASHPDSESSDKMGKTDELPGIKSPYSAEERENIKQPSLSPLSPMIEDSTENFAPSFRKGYKPGKWFSDVNNPHKSPFELPSRKEMHLKEDKIHKRNLSSLPAFATAETEETNVSDKESEECSENYLTRAFQQLLVVLGNFQTKIKSETSNKSAEILAATSQIIHQHLEGVELQMQADLDKLVSAGKSKRKRLKSMFEEQQEKLRALHERFREEVNEQFLDCRNSLEDFEAYNTELKGVVDKQKASHKKVLQNVEEAIGAQLNDAETKIAEVQKRAKKKMNGLKYVLKELLAEV